MKTFVWLLVLLLAMVGCSSLKKTTGHQASAVLKTEVERVEIAHQDLEEAAASIEEEANSIEQAVPIEQYPDVHHSTAEIKKQIAIQRQVLSDIWQSLHTIGHYVKEVAKIEVTNSALQTKVTGLETGATQYAQKRYVWLSIFCFGMSAVCFTLGLLLKSKSLLLVSLVCAAGQVVALTASQTLWLAPYVAAASMLILFITVIMVIRSFKKLPTELVQKIDDIKQVVPPDSKAKIKTVLQKNSKPLKSFVSTVRGK